LALVDGENGRDGRQAEHALAAISTEKSKGDSMANEENDSVKKSRLSWAAVFIGGVILIDLIGAHLMPFVQNRLARPGIQVTIRNTGSKTLRSVVVHVTGESYSLGNLIQGATAETIVRATGDSHLEIEFTDAEGETKRLNAGGYFEPGYRGTIQVAIKDGVIDKNDQQVTP
jgi:hypothetical protein